MKPSPHASLIHRLPLDRLVFSIASTVFFHLYHQWLTILTTELFPGVFANVLPHSAFSIVNGLCCKLSVTIASISFEIVMKVWCSIGVVCGTGFANSADV